MSRFCPCCMDPLQNDGTCASCDGAPQNDCPYALAPGTLLRDRYLVGRVLGEGGFGITYVGRDTTLDMKIAIKEYYPSSLVNRPHSNSNQVLPKQKGTRPFKEGKARFLQEAKNLAQFSEAPGIVTVRDCFEENSTAYIVMSYVEGETLKQYVKRQGRVSFAQIIQWLGPVMQSLEKLHAKNLIHRDISPDNLIVHNGKCTLIDFGAARRIETQGGQSVTVVYKDGYTPEEQYRSRGEQGAWTDVYALCATIYFAITAHEPENVRDRLHMDELVAPSELGASITAAQEDILLKGLAVRAEKRTQSVGEILAQLHQLAVAAPPSPVAAPPSPVAAPLAPMAAPPSPVAAVPQQAAVKPADAQRDEPPRIPPPGPEAPPPKPKRVNWVRWALGALGVVALVCAIVGYNYAFFSIGGTSTNIMQTRVSLDGENFDVKDLHKLGRIRNLETLYIRNAALGEEQVAFISTLGTLKSLELVSCEITNDAFASMGKLPNLRWVRIEDAPKLTDAGPLAQMDKLIDVNITGTGIESIDFLAGKPVKYLVLNNNQIKDLSPLNSNEVLYSFHAASNQIENLTPLAGCSYLGDLLLDNNAIASLNGLAGCTSLTKISLRNNFISSLLPLKNCTKLTDIHVNKNRLENFAGAEKWVHLTTISAADNNIQNLSALENCTLLESVDLDNNKVANLTVLSKNRQALKSVRIGNNSVQDITPLQGAVLLEQFHAPGNLIDTIGPLSESTKLTYLNIAHNKVVALAPLSACTNLRELDCSFNKISSLDNFPTLPHETTVTMIFTGNEIETIDSLPNAKYRLLALDRNPIGDVAHLKDLYYVAENATPTLTLDYNAAIDFETVAKSGFEYVYIRDVPLDQQVRLETTLTQGGSDVKSWGLYFADDLEIDAMLLERTKKT